jgi:hypothetical protein
MALRDRVISSYIRMEAHFMTNQRAAQTRKAGTPGPEGAVAKLVFAEENKRNNDLCMTLMAQMPRCSRPVVRWPSGASRHGFA